MTLAQFDNGYWYTTELRDFAQRIGIAAASKKGATRAQAIKTWKQLKQLDIPKDYSSWLEYRRSSL